MGSLKLASLRFAAVCVGMLTAASWLPTAAAREVEPPTAATIASQTDEFCRAHVAVNHFSGSVLVARGPEVLVAKGYGLASVELEVPNTPQTKFRLGSITKQFTAMAILILQEQGKLSVDDLASKYVEGCP